MSVAKVRTALEGGLSAMANIVPAVTIASSSVASPTVITTATPHGLPVGAVVLATISGHVGSTPALSGVYRATATGASTLTLQTNAQTPANVAASVGGAGGTFSANLTAYENVAFTPPSSPPPGVPYQRVNLIFAQPDNDEQNRYYIERGFMQVGLLYPIGAGSGAAATRAELIRSTFFRGASFASGGVTTNIERTPEIAAAQVEGDRWFAPVRVRFYAHITA